VQTDRLALLPACTPDRRRGLAFGWRCRKEPGEVQMLEVVWMLDAEHDNHDMRGSPLASLPSLSFSSVTHTYESMPFHLPLGDLISCGSPLPLRLPHLSPSRPSTAHAPNPSQPSPPSTHRGLNSELRSGQQRASHQWRRPSMIHRPVKRLENGPEQPLPKLTPSPAEVDIKI